MPKITPYGSWIVVALALAAVAAWPSFVSNRSESARAASLPTPAPITADYRERDKLIAFWEGAVNEHHRGDMLSPRMLSAYYLQRYRERGDIDDVTRAVREAEVSLQAQPRGNQAADVSLASAFLTLHRFKEALTVTKKIETYDPDDPDMLAREASLDLELGRYAAAKRIIGRLPRLAQMPGEGESIVGVQTLQTRWLELTGQLAQARELFTHPTAETNAQFGVASQQRAWFYFRSGELAFEAGDNDAAIADEQQALEVFPRYSEANRLLARFECALHRWQACLDAAKASADVVPYPEVLGYEVDAQRALGDEAGAERTDGLIRTIEKIGNAQHVSDRLLAIYYSEHGENLGDAYRIARRELAVRDDIFTEDTLAWAAAADGRWPEARERIRKALRFNTENSLLQYHAGAIALHFGDRAEAKRRLERSLALNPQFHPVYADEARAMLARL
jgi:tetratricopeptide (TPR) repeat protein